MSVATIGLQSRIAGAARAAMAFTHVLAASMLRRRRGIRDRRALQTMPDYMLADIGLEKIEFRSSSDGRRDVWVIPHRYY